MKRVLNPPFFEIGIKNYLFGDDVLELARTADHVACRLDVDVLLVTPYTEIRRVAENTERLIVLAPYMDLLRPGRGMADILPEALKAAGAEGVVINHCEKPLSLNAIKRTIERANELEMLSFVCTESIAESCAVAFFHPDIINPEPTELIGSGSVSSLDFVRKSIDEIKKIDPAILIEQAAGITNGAQVYDFIMAGAEAVGAASGICTAKNPFAKAEELIDAVARARNDLQKTVIRRNYGTENTA